ncbi:hypothetical protein TCAL_01797 [Tigriopus californicus]|uniref:Carboxylesterase type B domain-containing protein n=1 Tax=Tigriopus californicus TaxID=6832 RepID=A0A553N7D5_TIGCA|nr:hypothetical protein TCAL_01797 [Tigriopus californicus]
MIICVTFLCLTFGLTNAGNLQVVTENGVLQGKHLTTSNGDVIEAYLGVPYAQPPIGKLRFRPPRDPLSWNTVRDATLPPPSCFQRRDEFFEDGRDSQDNQPLYGPSEDCLFINIYTPDYQNQSVPDNGHPVMVWFHGGGFSFGSSFSRGSPNWSPDPRELVSEGQVIVVYVQYRLGSFGFLFLDDELAPGNMGLLDQQLALNWIKRNIFAFRGDPTKVTLGGQDSGGVSALMQAIMTKKEPFYKKLILQSSGIQHPWSFIEATEAFRRTLKLAALLGCSVTGSREDVLGCLIRKSPEDIVNKEMGVVAFPTINFHPFVMTVDGKTIFAEPKKLLHQYVKRQKDVSVLLGSNRNEGTKSLVHFMPTVFPRQELTEEILDRDTFQIVVNRLFADSPLHVQKAIKFQYTNWTDDQSDHSRFQLLTKMVADHQYDCPLDETVTLMADRFKIFRRSTIPQMSFMEKPVFEESEDLLPPINVLSKTSVLSAADPSFKLVTSEDVITDDDLVGHDSDHYPVSVRQESNPEAQKISYSLSVMNRMPSVNSEDWTLFRPEEPGNSPIYIARGTYNSPSTTKAPYPRNQQSVVPSRSRPLGVQKPTSTESSSHTKVYDPFNPATYTRSMLTRRTGEASIIRLNGEGRGNPFYYPNYAPVN